MSARIPPRSDAAASGSATAMARWPVMVMAATVVGVATWLWLREPVVETGGSESTMALPVAPTVPAVAQPAMTASTPAAEARPAPTASGRLHLERTLPGSSELTSLDMEVGGRVALREPREHRLRVLLVDEAMNPSIEQQMRDYLQSERLADSGRAHAVLELHFRPTSQTFDRDGLESASLTVTNPDGTMSSSADVLKSLKWDGGVLSLSGGGVSSDSAAGRDSWQLSVTIPAK